MHWQNQMYWRMKTMSPICIPFPLSWMTGSTRKKDKKEKVLCHAYYSVEFYQCFSILHTGTCIVTVPTGKCIVPRGSCIVPTGSCIVSTSTCIIVSTSTCIVSTGTYIVSTGALSYLQMIVMY